MSLDSGLCIETQTGPNIYLNLLCFPLQHKLQNQPTFPTKNLILCYRPSSLLFKIIIQKPMRPRQIKRDSATQTRSSLTSDLFNIRTWWDLMMNSIIVCCQKSIDTVSCLIPPVLESLICKNKGCYGLCKLKTNLFGQYCSACKNYQKSCL